ncbi:hypothetical protein LTR17_017279 [Elasticomyces elasticus]|nr:hypothetical protein LTR17_017279 [Elasticomyces elasticus]
MYEGLKYGGFYAQKANGETQGLKAGSGSIVAAANVLSDVVLFGKLEFAPFATISVNSSYKSFSFFALDLGCRTSASSEVGEAKPCNVLVTGFKQVGEKTIQLPPVKLDYTTAGLTNQKLKRFGLGYFDKGYDDILNITLGVAIDSGLAIDTTVYIDDVSVSKNCIYAT